MIDGEGTPHIVVVTVGHFEGDGKTSGVYLTPDARSEEEAVEVATDMMTLRDYKRIVSIKVIAVDSMTEVHRW